MIKTIQMPSKKETLTVIVIMALFLLLTVACIGLRSEHLLMAGTLSGFIFCRTTYPEAGSGLTAFRHFRDLV